MFRQLLSLKFNRNHYCPDLTGVPVVPEPDVVPDVVVNTPTLFVKRAPVFSSHFSQNAGWSPLLTADVNVEPASEVFDLAKFGSSPTPPTAKRDWLKNIVIKSANNNFIANPLSYYK